MPLLQQIKSGDVYIRTKDDYELALVINFMLDNKIWFMNEAPLDDLCFYGDEHIFLVTLQHRKPILGMTFNEGILIKNKLIDITDQFFSEVAK